MGYMPGEIYSFGIVYIFKDNSLSPVFHIPGRSSSVPNNVVFGQGTNLYPMSPNNVSIDNRYVDNDNCAGSSYWGQDSEGDDLLNTQVRHHRFPLRTDYNLPLVEKANSTTISDLFKRFHIQAAGTIDTPVECIPSGEPGYDPACVPTVEPVFDIEISYTEDGVAQTFTALLDPAEWGGDATAVINYSSLSNLLSGTNIIITGIKENGVAVAGTWASGVFTSTSTSPKGLDYSISLIDAINEYTEDTYIGTLFGIKFSNIELPDPIEFNGQEVIGYYIVRNERKEEDKTVLDSAVLTPTVKNKNFVAAGLLMPQFNIGGYGKIKRDILNFINPEFKFNQKKYSNFTVLQQGNFVKTEAIYSRTKINDVMDGSSYVSGKHKIGESDKDGWSIQIKTRDNITDFENATDFEYNPSDIKETFYLDALADKLIIDHLNVGADVFNLACDNKTGILSLNQDITFPILSKVPYVYFLRGNANPYSNFRVLPYYKESKAPHYFDNGNEATIFNGDSYICPMRYVNSIFYDNRIKKRKGKSSALNFIIGAILVIAAVAVTIFSLGTASPAALALVSAGASLLIGAGTMLIMSGIKQDAWNKAYSGLYDQGLRETIADDYVKFDTDPITNEERGFSKNPSDDEIQWLGDCLNLWFESAVNMNLRHGCTDNTPDFLGAPGNGELGTTYPETDREYFGIHSVKSIDIPPTTTLDNHMVKKLTYFDYNRKAQRAYVGIALAEVYQINPDYLRRDKQKIFNHLSLEYDCCSECQESFPDRFHYSLQAFQEELTDNFRTFLPNNYVDIPGEGGKITDIFKIQNNLYVHSQEALWHFTRNLQERAGLEGIISFIGTGDYFNMAPRKVVDDTNSSAGNLHKWGRIKTRHGVLFPCHREKKWYLFDGERLIPVSSYGMQTEFDRHMRFFVEEQYYNLNRANYPYSNNPSNRIGVGYISVYDTQLERVIVTKKDFQLKPNFLPAGTEICDEGSDIIVFPNMQQTIADMEIAGWQYVGIEDCKLKFIRTTYNLEEVDSQIIVADGEDYTLEDSTREVSVPTTEVKYGEGETVEAEDFETDNSSVTMSFSLEDKQWVSYHSFLPSFYFHVEGKFYSWKHGLAELYKHNIPHTYRNFYGVTYPTIIEYVDNNNPLATKVTDGIMFQAEAYEFDPDSNEYRDIKDMTFNKLVAYNSHQITGMLDVVVKNDATANYLLLQTISPTSSITVDRNERDWTINALRNYKVQNIPMFLKTLTALQPDYFIDKVVNPAAVDFNKDWTQVESLRDKFLVVRLIFDNFDDIKMVMNFAIDDTKISER